MFSKASIMRGLVGAIVPLAAAASAFGFQSLPPGGQVNDDKAAGIDKTLDISGEGPANADVVGGALAGGKPAVPWAVLRQTEPAGVARPGLCALLRGWLLDDAWQRHGRRAVERRAAVQRLAELRPGPGRRGALDRLRGHRTHRALGDLVREHERNELRKQQHLREPLRQHG